MDLCIALGPIAIYLLVIGSLNLSNRPFVTSGGRDLFAVALAISGLAVVGPLDLFMPEASAAFFRGWVWIPLIILYLLFALLTCMLQRPRIVLYNVNTHELRPILQQTAEQMDPDTHWAGDAMNMPSCSLQMFLQSQPGTRNIQLVAAGGNQSPLAWHEFENRLKVATKDLHVGRNPRGFGLVFAGSIMLASIAFALFSGKDQIVERIEQFLRF